MRIVNKILLKVWEKIKINTCFKFCNIRKNYVENSRQIMYIVENMRLINDMIRNLKTEKFLIF